MAEPEHDETAHPGVGQYVQIGVILAVLTTFEVILYEAGQRGLIAPVTVPALIVLTVAKFLLVVMWFMHLRFDHRLFRRLFAVGVVGAITVFGIVIAIIFLGR